MIEKLKKRQEQQDQGITLVALIITIVILVILAAVTINAVFKNNFIGIATQGTENYSYGQVQESKTMDETADMIQEATEKIANSIQSIKARLEQALQKAQVEKSQNENFDKEEDLNRIIREEIDGVEISGDEIKYKEYIFIIDRDKLEIISVKENEAPVLVSADVVERTPNTVSIKVVAEDKEDDEIKYAVNIGTEEGKLKRKESKIEKTEEGAIITVENLNEYTEYYIEFNVTDGYKQATGLATKFKTKCSGTGEAVCPRF